MVNARSPIMRVSDVTTRCSSLSREFPGVMKVVRMLN